jgi:hypothetical protein
LPAEFVAVIEKIVKGRTAVGVPEIIQVKGLSEAHAGRDGDAEQFVIAAPLLFNTIGVTDIATPQMPEVPVAPE